MVLECSQWSWLEHNELVLVLRNAKGNSFWRVLNTVIWVVNNTMNMWLFEGCKKERSLKSVGTQSMKLLKTQRIGGCLRQAKGNGLWRLLEHSQRSWWKQNELGLVWGMQKGTVSLRCLNAVKGANQNTMNWWLVEGCKRNVLWRVLDSSHWSCLEHKECVIVEWCKRVYFKDAKENVL